MLKLKKNDRYEMWKIHIFENGKFHINKGMWKGKRKNIISIIFRLFHNSMMLKTTRDKKSDARYKTSHHLCIKFKSVKISFFFCSSQS